MTATLLGRYPRTSGSLTTPIPVGTAVPVGGVVVVQIGGVFASGVTGTVTDSRGNTYVQREFQTSNTTSVALYECSTVTTALQVGDTITFTQTGSTVANGYGTAHSLPEGYTYVDSSSALGNSTTPASGTNTSSAAATTHLGLMMSSRGSSTPNPLTAPAPWSLVDSGESGSTTRKWYGSYEAEDQPPGALGLTGTLGVSGSTPSGVAGAWGAVSSAYAAPEDEPDPVAGTVESIWPGRPKQTTARVVSRLTGGTSVRLAVSTSPSMTSPTYVAAQVPDADGYVTHDVTGLTPDTRYYFRCADTPSGGVEELVGDVATLHTLQTAGLPVTRTMLVGACVRTNSVNPGALLHAAAREPQLGSFMGDFTYGGQGSSSQAVHEGVYEAQLANVAAERALVAKGGAGYYLPSDHDTSNVDNADSNDVVGAAALAARKHITPMGPGNATATDDPAVDGRFGHYWLDIRTTDRSTGSSADGPGKTMLGAAQEARFEAWIESTDAQWLFVHCDTALLGDPDNVNKTDWWPAYPTARARFVGLLNAAVAAGKKVTVVHGDSHAVAYCTPEDNPLGDFAVLCAAGYDQDGGGRNLSLFTASWNNASGDVQEYGWIAYSDDLDTMTVTYEGWDAVGNVARVAFTETLEAAPQEAQLARATVAITGRAVGTVAGGTARALTRATVFVAGRAVGVAAGATSRVLTRAGVVASGRTITTSGTTAATLARATVTLTGRAAGAAPGAAARTLARAGVTVAGRAATPQASRSVALQRATTTATARPVTASAGAAARALTRAQVTTTGRIVTTGSDGAATLARATVPVTGRAVGRTAGPAARALSRATVAATGRTVTSAGDGTATLARATAPIRAAALAADSTASRGIGRAVVATVGHPLAPEVDDGSVPSQNTSPPVATRVRYATPRAMMRPRERARL